MRKDNVFQLTKQPLLSPNGYADPDSFGIFREDTKNWLGTVGKQFTILQPQTILSKLEQEFAQHDVSFQAYKGGAKCVFRIELDRVKVKTLKVGDEVGTAFEVTIGYDGSLSLTGNLFTEVLRCTNGMVANISKEKNKFRNTRSVRFNFNLMTDRISAMYGMRKAFADLAQDLADTSWKVNQKNIDAVNERLFGFSRDDIKAMEEGRGRTIAENKFENMTQSIIHETNAVGGNLWGLLNGVTWYTNHVIEKDDQDEYIRFQSGNTLNQKGLQLVQSMV